MIWLLGQFERTCVVMSPKAVTYFSPVSILFFQKLVFCRQETGEKWGFQVLMMQKTIRKTCFNVAVFCILHRKYKKAKRDLKDHLEGIQF